MPAAAPPGSAPATRHCVAGRKAGLAAALLVALAVALLGACAQAPTPGAPVAMPGAPAPTGPTARVLLRGAVPGDDRFALVQLTDTALCQGPRLLTSGDARQTPAPANLVAGEMTTLDFVVLRGGKPQCGVRWSFTPEAGKTYLAQGLVVGNGCTARLMDASITGQPPKPAAGVLLRNGPGQACLALDKSRPAGSADSLIQGGQQDGEAVLRPGATAQDLQGLIRP